jgi:hypothetical protein
MYTKLGWLYWSDVCENQILLTRFSSRHHKYPGLIQIHVVVYEM